MKKYTTATPNIASYVLLRKGNKVAFVLRSNTDWMNNYYGLPSGKVENKESYASAAVREAKEEVGVDIDVKNLKFIHVMHRFEPSSQAEDWVDIFFETTNYKGKPYNAEPHVHSELVWLDPKNLPKNTIPSVAFALSQIEQGKAYSEYGW